MRIFVVLLLASGLVALTGCGKQSNENPTAAPATNAPPMEPATNGPAK